MIRGMLISSIYASSLHSRLPQSAKKEAITLASTDVDRICYGLVNVHEIWANIIEAGFGMYLLQSQIGNGCIAPLAIIMGKSHVSCEHTTLNIASSRHSVHLCLCKHFTKNE